MWRIGSRRWAGSTLVGLTVLMGIGVPLVSAFVTGTIDIPQNDDWAYSRIVLNLHQTGHLHLVGWNEMSLVGHLLWGLLFLEVFGANVRASPRAGVGWHHWDLSQPSGVCTSLRAQTCARSGDVLAAWLA